MLALTRLWRTSLAATAVLAIAGAAGAQPGGQPGSQEQPPVTGQTVTPPADATRGDGFTADQLGHPDYSLSQREARLAAELDKSVADGSLGHHEYARATTALADIRATEDRLRKAGHGELTDAQTFRLESRIKTLAESVHWKR